jgi:hypothetical protein
MYYIYHIKGVKWGMTNNLQRRLEQQNYTSADEVIEEADLDKAADLEKELNLRDGYPWNDTQDYRVISKLAKEGAKAQPLSAKIKGGKTTGEKNKNSGYMSELGKKWGSIQGKKRKEDGTLSKIGKKTCVKNFQTKVKCEHCGFVTNKGNYKQHHGDNCKYKEGDV